MIAYRLLLDHGLGPPSYSSRCPVDSQWTDVSKVPCKPTTSLGLLQCSSPGLAHPHSPPPFTHCSSIPVLLARSSRLQYPRPTHPRIHDNLARPGPSIHPTPPRTSLQHLLPPRLPVPVPHIYSHPLLLLHPSSYLPSSTLYSSAGRNSNITFYPKGYSVTDQPPKGILWHEAYFHLQLLQLPTAKLPSRHYFLTLFTPFPQ